MAMLGREVLLPASLIARPPVEPIDTTVPFVTDIRDVMHDAHDLTYGERCKNKIKCKINVE